MYSFVSAFLGEMSQSLLSGAVPLLVFTVVLRNGTVTAEGDQMASPSEGRCYGRGCMCHCASLGAGYGTTGTDPWTSVSDANLFSTPRLTHPPALGARSCCYSTSLPIPRVAEYFNFCKSGQHTIKSFPPLSNALGPLTHFLLTCLPPVNVWKFFKYSDTSPLKVRDGDLVAAVDKPKPWV